MSKIDTCAPVPIGNFLTQYESYDFHTRSSVARGLSELINALIELGLPLNPLSALMSNPQSATPPEGTFSHSRMVERIGTLNTDLLLYQIRNWASELPLGFVRGYHGVNTDRLKKWYRANTTFLQTPDPLQLFDAFVVELYPDDKFQKGALPQPWLIVSREPQESISLELILPHKSEKSHHIPLSFDTIWRLDLTNNPDRSDTGRSQPLWPTLHLAYMDLAVAVAQLSFDRGGLPIGAVLVENDTLPPTITLAHNSPSDNPPDHAEVLVLNNRRYSESPYSILYSTLEPCPSCATACEQQVDYLYYVCRHPPGWDHGRHLLHQPSPDLHIINRVQTAQLPSHMNQVLDLLRLHGDFPDTISQNETGV